MRVYIASPYSSGDTAKNVGKSFKVANKLIDKGYFPFSPLLNHYLDIMKHRDYDVWLKQDLEWLQFCDAVIRLPGFSRGADTEVSIAKNLNIPVYYSLEEFLEDVSSK